MQSESSRTAEEGASVAAGGSAHPVRSSGARMGPQISSASRRAGSRNSLPHAQTRFCLWTPPHPAGSVTRGRKPLLSAEGSSWLESVAKSCAANTPLGQGNSCTGQGLSKTTVHLLCCSENGVTVMQTFTELLEQYKVHLQAMHI